MENKKLFIGGATIVVLLLVALLVYRSFGASEGNPQANVADFAKTIDHTNSSTPSVPPERLKLGVSGARGKH